MSFMASPTAGPNAFIPEFLNHTNYEHWSQWVKTNLLSEDLWNVVEPATEIPLDVNNDWTRKNAKALHIIHHSCGSGMFYLISGISSAKDAWAGLEKWFKEKQKADKDAKEFERYRNFLAFVGGGDWEKAQDCLTKLPDSITAKDELGDIALHIAAREGHLHIVQELLLLMSREDLQTKNANGSTAIHEAFQMERVDAMKELLPVMGGVQNCDGDTVLHIAVRMQQGPVTVKDMVKCMRREDLEIKNNYGYTALHIAVEKGDVPTIKELLPYDDDFDQYISFIDAVTEGDWSTAKDFLRALDPYRAVRARDHREGHDENTALHLAAKHGHVDIVKELVSLMTQEPFFEAMTQWEVENADDDDPSTRNLYADLSEGEVIRIAKYMVEQNEILLAGLLEVVNAFGDTPLHNAVTEGHISIVIELVPLMRKEGFEIKNNEGLTAVHRAVMLGNMGILSELVLLMTHECLLVKTHKQGSNALHLAVRGGNLDIVKMLVSRMRREDLEINDAYGCTALHLAVVTGNLEMVRQLVSVMRQEGLELKDDYWYRNALHVAVVTEKRNMNIVRELISRMRPQAMEVKDGGGRTALALAMEVNDAKIGDIWEVAKYMAEKNNKVFGLRSPKKIIPVVWAAIWNMWKLTHFLYHVTPPEALNGVDGAQLLTYALDRMMALDLAWNLLQRFPILALKAHKSCPIYELAKQHYAFFSGARLTFWQSWIYNSPLVQPPNDFNNLETLADVQISEDDQGISWPLTGLCELLGINKIYKMKSAHMKVTKILHKMAEVIKTYDLTEEQVWAVKASILKAIELGHVEFVTHICKENPNLMHGDITEKEGNMFHVAVSCRQEKIYSLIYGFKKEKREKFARTAITETETSLLHSAANLSPFSQYSRIQGASLQMQRELQWFKEVESLVPHDSHGLPNTDMLTARQLFTQSHEKLMKEAKESMKQTASACTVVGSLITTMMFAAAFTVPGGNNGDTGIPMFIHKKLFLTFIVSDTLSLVSSTTSVIVFLGLLTSRYAEDDFLISLPRKLMTGLITLFISIATMMIAFSYALIIMLQGKYSWIVAPSIFLACSVPIASFVWVQSPLLWTTLISTYGPGIFDKKTKPWC